MDTEQVKLIYDYAKFHIGIYSTVITGLIALIGFGYVDFRDAYLFWIGLIIFVLLIAGIAGAVVASRIVYGNWSSGSFDPSKSRFWKQRRWSLSWVNIFLFLEHYAFWGAIILAFLAFVLVPFKATTLEKDAINKAARAYFESLSKSEVEAIAKFSADGANYQQVSAGSFNIKSIRFIKPDLALAEGDAVVNDSQANNIVKLKSGQFTSLISKKNAQWAVKYWDATFQ